MNEWDVGNAMPVKTDVFVVSSGVHCYNTFETPFIRLLVKAIEDSLCVASQSGGQVERALARRLGNGTEYK